MEEEEEVVITNQPLNPEEIYNTLEEEKVKEVVNEEDDDEEKVEEIDIWDLIDNEEGEITQDSLQAAYNEIQEDQYDKLSNNPFARTEPLQVGNITVPPTNEMWWSEDRQRWNINYLDEENKTKATQINEYLDRQDKLAQESEEAWKQYVKVAQPGEVIISKDGNKEYKYDLMDTGQFQYNYRTPGSEDWQNFEFNEDGTTTDPEFINALVEFQHGEVKETPKQRRLAPNKSNLRAKQYQFMNWEPDESIDIDYYNRLGGKTKSNQRLKDEGDTNFEDKWKTQEEGFELSKEYLEAKIIDEDLDITYPYLNYYINPANTETEIDSVINKYYPDISNLASSPFQVYDNDSKPLRSQEEIDMEVKNFAGYLDQMDVADQIVLLGNMVDNPTLWSQKEAPDNFETLLDRTWDMSKDVVKGNITNPGIGFIGQQAKNISGWIRDAYNIAITKDEKSWNEHLLESIGEIWNDNREAPEVLLQGKLNTYLQNYKSDTDKRLNELNIIQSMIGDEEVDLSKQLINEQTVTSYSVPFGTDNRPFDTTTAKPITETITTIDTPEEFFDKKLGELTMPYTNWDGEQGLKYEQLTYPELYAKQERYANDKLIRQKRQANTVTSIMDGLVFGSTGFLDEFKYAGEDIGLWMSGLIDNTLPKDSYLDKEYKKSIMQFDENRKWERARSDTGLYGIITGKSYTDDKGVEYIMDERGVIYDTDSKFAIDTSMEGYESIRKNLLNSNTRASSFSPRGAFETTTKVFGNLAMQIASTRGVGLLTAPMRASLLTSINGFKNVKQFKFAESLAKSIGNKNLNGIKKLPIKQSTVDAIATQGMFFMQIGDNEIRRQAMAAGVSYDEADALAQKGSLMYGAIGMLTAPLAPLARTNQSASAEFIKNSTIRQLVLDYGKTNSKNAFARFGNRLKDTFWKWRNNPTNVAMFTEGGKEMVQENVSESAIVYGVNPGLNEQLDASIFQDNITLQEGLNLSFVSSIAGGLGGRITNSVDYESNPSTLQALYMAGKDYQVTKAQLEKLVLGKAITVDEMETILRDMDVVRSEGAKTQSWISAENQLPILRLNYKIRNLQNRKKNFKLVGTEVEVIDNQINDLIEEKNNLLKPDVLKKWGDIIEGSEKISQDLEQDFYEGDQTGINNEINKILEENPEADVDRENEKDYGVFVTIPAKDGKPQRTITLVNKDTSLKDTIFTTGQHEVFHGLLNAFRKKFALELAEWKKGGKKADAPENPINKLGLSLLNELKNNENVIFNDKTSGRSLEARIEGYLGDKSKSLDTVIEEIMPLLSEALTDGGVEIKQDAWGKIGDFFRRFFQYFGKKIKFKEGVDVINLVRDYNKAIESKKGIKRNKFFDIITLGQLPETGLQRFGKGEADINLDVDIEAGKTELKEGRDQVLDEDPFGEKSDSKSSKKINDVDLKINESEFKQNMRKYNEDKLSVDLIDDIYTPYLKAGMSSLKRIGASEGKVKGTQIFDLRDPTVFEEVESALGTEFQSFLDNYNPELSDPTTYSDFMALRILPDIVDLLAKKGKSLDAMKAEKGFDVEGDSQVDFDVSSRKSTARKKKYASSIPAIKNQITENIGADLVGGVDIDGRVTGLAKDIIGNIGRNTDPETVAKDIIKNTKAKEVMIPFRELVGKWGSREYNDFVDQIINQGLISTIPSATIKRRLGFQRNVDAGLLDYKKTGKTKQIKVKDGKKTYSEPDIFEITRIDKTKLKEYYKDNEKRQQSLFSMIAESVLAEGVQTLRNDKQFMDRLRTTLELKNSPLSTNEFMDGLEQKLDQRTKEDTSLDNISVRSSMKITTADKQRIGFLTRNKLNTRQYWKKQLGKDYMLGKPGDNKDKTKWTEEDYEKRDFNTLNFIPELGSGFVSIQSVTGNTNTMFYRKLEAGRDDLQKLLDNDLPTKFVEQSFTEDGNLIPDSYIDKGLKAKKPYIKEVDGKYRFIKKNLPEYGSVFTKRDIDVLKQGALDQKSYVNWSEEKFRDKFNDPNFRAQEQDKLTVFKKLLEYIESQVWKSGDFDPEVFGFWASWMASQASVSDHPVRALSPILFSSISGIPLKSRLYDKETGLPVVKSTKLTLEDGTIKLKPVFKSTQKDGSLPDWVMVNNYVAEHAFQANNGSKIALDAIRNKNVKKQWKFISDHYSQGQLLKTDDDLVNLLFKEKLPNEFFDMNNPNIWVRYLLGNPNINLNEYIMWSDKKKKVVTIAEELGLSLAKKDQNPNSIALQNRLLLERLGIYQYQEETYIDEPRSVASVKKELKSALNVDSKSSKQVNNNKETLFNLITSNSTTEASIEAMKNADTAIKKGNIINKPTKGISVFDFDDTLAFSDSKVIVELNDGTIQKITPAEFAATAEQLLENGAEFNFDEFNKVVNGRKGPLADLALKRQAKFGSGDIFVLTARPQASARSIKLFLEGIGLNLPLKNITGLENGSPEAKALWVVDKAADGYNDFYFADDALPNVQAVENVLSQIDVKSKVQQAKVKYSKRLGKDLAKNKNYKKFINSLKGSVLYHGGTASLSDSKAIWFIANNVDGAELYADRTDGKVYSIDSNNLKNAVIIPDVADLMGLDSVIENKYKSISDQIIDEYGQVDIKKVLETEAASEIISDLIDYIDNNFELADGVYGPDTLYDSDGKISKGTPVIVIGGNASTKVKKVEVPKSMRTIPAVADVLSQIDVKSKVQQALSSKKVDLDREFNEIIEQQTGKEWFKKYSDARAEVEGRKANRFEFFIPPSAEDFLGLTYRFLPKGENGNRALQWVTDNLLDPFNEGEQAVISAKMTVANDFKALRDSLENIPDNLMDESGYSNFSWSQALRVYIWDMQGMDIPGLSKRDLNRLKKVIEDNVDMKIFAEKIAFIQKGKEYPAPSNNWVAGSITSDIIDSIQKVYRKEALAKWQQNVDIIFSKTNMNKLEALYGSNYTIALKDILGRMKRGSNRPVSNNAQVDNVMDWVNNSVGTTMFLNRKSALLQLISNVNFINWSDNNILEAGKAFANQKQYWTDVMYLLNSDYLVQRRNGLKINVAESEIAEAAKRGGFKGAVAYLLNKGFVFTRFADSLAIATGGATFYRNRVNRLLKTVNIDTGKLYTKAEADRKAFNDFYKISEETQQSSRTDRISMQQSSGLGRVVLNYANTPMQYARIIKRSTQDLLAGRGDWRTNISRIVYYGAIQNLIFNALQQALFSLAFAEDDEPEKQDRTAKDKAKGIGYGMLSSLLRGLGYGGALVDTLISISRQISMGKDGLPVISEDAVYNIADFSPSIDSKIRKFRAVQKTFTYNRKEILRRGFNLDNPAYLAFGQVIDAAFNVPLDQALRMVMSIKQASDRDTELWQRFALLAGWSSWSIGLPYWGTTTTVGNEAKEDDEIKSKYKNDARKLKGMGYKRIPMTKGKPKGELMEDYIKVTRPTGDTEYWLTPKK